MRFKTLVGLTLLTAGGVLGVPLVVGTLSDAGPGPQHALSAAPPASCQAITPTSLTAFARTIDRALRSATADARANGQNGEYAVAARNSRDLLQRAKVRIEEGAAALQSSDPRVTTFAEGGMVKEHVRSALAWISDAAHWALISGAYHKSTDARDAFEGAMAALADGQGLYVDSGRCFLSNYL